MTNKCKICGYRFKSKDEIICPECFTAREDDISCYNYSKDLHDHGNGIDDRFSRNDFGTDKSYNESDFSGSNSFVNQELKKERQDKFISDNFKNEQKVDATQFNESLSSQSSTLPKYNENLSSQSRTLPKYNNNLNQTNSNTYTKTSYSTNTYTNQYKSTNANGFDINAFVNARKKTGAINNRISSLAVIIVIIIIGSTIIPAIRSAFTDSKESSYVSNDDKQVFENNGIDPPCFTSGDGAYKFSVTNFVFEDIDDNTLTTSLLGNAEGLTEETDWYIIKYDLIVDSNDATAGVDTINLTSTSAYAYDENTTEISKDFVSCSDTIELSQAPLTKHVEMIADKNSTKINLYINFYSYNDDDQYNGDSFMLKYDTLTGEISDEW